ncbi:MAG TPA: GlsB/YeaQ/YmgE family stress response membrane protein [Xanthobacteraceae bacterium]|nr:GlsB/YeaQ/YmgE family stress response membrane protein [Xanthobacteraceae bacterium]
MLTSLIIWIVIGLIAGWLAAKIVQGTGYGLVGDIAIGIAGALIAGWLFPFIGLTFGGGIIAAIIHATIGAVVLLVILRLVKQGGKM